MATGRDSSDFFAFDLGRYISERAALIERALERSVAAQDGAESRLFEAMRYSLLGGGKRLRPVLAIAACEAAGGNVDDVLGFATALEMIHTYSLIHDDLPCMDDDDLRRGRPTNHVVYGEAIATLAGDGLLTDAFRVLASSTGAPRAVLLEVIIELARAAGPSGMVGGQVIDLLGEGRALSLEEIETLHRKKTGALIEAAVCCGARLGGATEAQMQSLRNYAQAVGLAFQVADDLLDVQGSAADAGKRTGKDEARGKATYPALMGIEQSRALARELVTRAHRALKSFGPAAEALRALASFAVERKS